MNSRFAVLASLVLVSCTLDDAGKNRCVGDSDCVEPYSCIDGFCGTCQPESALTFCTRLGSGSAADHEASLTGVRSSLKVRAMPASQRSLSASARS
jgi:hypothetical protein